MEGEKKRGRPRRGLQQVEGESYIHRGVWRHWRPNLPRNAENQERVQNLSAKPQRCRAYIGSAGNIKTVSNVVLQHLVAARTKRL